jgi:hypothetical protein
MDNESRYEYAHWGFDLVQNSYLKKADLEKEDVLYIDYLRPFSEDFFGQMNPLLIFGGNSFKEISQKKTVTVRDGLIPLSIFFREMSPEDFNLDLFIPKTLWFIVPPSWRKKVKFYDVESTAKFNRDNLPQKIFISGILNSTFVDDDEFEIHIQTLVDKIGKDNIQKIEVSAFFPDKRNDLWGSWEEENVLKYSKAIFQKIKLDIVVPKWQDIHNEIDYKNNLYFEVNSGLFIENSYLSHFVLSRGGGLLSPEVRQLDRHFTKINSLKASLYHHYNFYELDYTELENFRDPFGDNNYVYFKRIIETQTTIPRINFRWEAWYASYLKRYYKNKKNSNSFF